MQQQVVVDLFHPLSELAWEECAEMPGRMSAPQCVLLQGRLHVGGGCEESTGETAILFISSPNLSSWTQETTPTGLYGLTTYHSQLVLVGGKKKGPPPQKPTNQLWVRTGSGGGDWNQTLPPMPTKRFSPLAVNTAHAGLENPEYLVVAGGRGVSYTLYGYTQEDAVEVLVGGQWSTLQPLPTPSHNLGSAFHTKNWFVRSRSDTCHSSQLHYCKVESLIASAMQSHGKDVSKEKLWKELHIPQDEACPILFGDELLVVGGFPPASLREFVSGTKVHAYCSLTQSWVHVGDLPMQVWSSGCVVLPSGELLAMKGSHGLVTGFSADVDTTPAMCKASLKGE